MNFNFLVTGLIIVGVQLISRVLISHSTECDINFDFGCHVMITLYDFLMLLFDIGIYLFYCCKRLVSALDQTMYIVFRELEDMEDTKENTEDNNENNTEENEEEDGVESIEEENTEENMEESDEENTEENMDDEAEELRIMSNKLNALESLISSLVDDKNKIETEETDVNKAIDDLEKSVTEICKINNTDSQTNDQQSNEPKTDNE